MARKSLMQSITDGQLKGAPRATLEDFFDDYYKHRRQIYVMNLVRGIFFGFGSVIGGTLVVALLLWALTVLHYVPFLDGLTNAVQHTLESSRK